MTTLGTLVTRVSARLKDPSFTAVTRAEVVAVINDAITFYADDRFAFNEFEETVPLTAGNPLLTLVTNIDPERIYNTNGIVINYASNRWPLNKISSEEYDALNVQGRGIPFAWTWRNGKYEVYYYPDAAYSAVVRGLKSYPPLALDADTNDFTDSADNLIMYESLSRLYAEFRQDDKMEAYYTGKAASEYRNLQKKKRNLVGTGRIQVGGL